MHKYLLKKEFANYVIREWNFKSAMFVNVFHEIRERYHCLFKQVFGPLCKLMEYEDQWFVGIFLL